MTNFLLAKPEIGNVIVLDAPNLINVLGETKAYKLLNDLAGEGHQFAVHLDEALDELGREDWQDNFTIWVDSQKTAGRMDDFSERVDFEAADATDDRYNPPDSSGQHPPPAKRSISSPESSCSRATTSSIHRRCTPSSRMTRVWEDGARTSHM